jgi:lysine-N-methylase
MNSKTKLEFYDDFKCIADRCTFSCCRGWNITVDPDTYTIWTKNQTQQEYFKSHLKTARSKDRSEGSIKMGADQSCPFLDDIGLCNIVKSHGEAYLPKTCLVFPRQENSFDNLQEYSLSCACPAVVDIINNLSGKVKLIPSGDEINLDTVPMEFSLRKVMISLLQNNEFSLKDRILLIFHLLLNMRQEPSISKEIINQYFDAPYLSSVKEIWSDIKVDSVDAFNEKNELFLDIVWNYRKEKNYIAYLKEISELAQVLEADNSIAQWNEFEKVFGEFDSLIENCLVIKIFANCINEEIDDMIMSFQLMITEFIMVKYSVFLKWLGKDKKTDYIDVRDYIVTYSRIIGYNADGIREFWGDSFEEAVWELGYLLLLLN